MNSIQSYQEKSIDFVGFIDKLGTEGPPEYTQWARIILEFPEFEQEIPIEKKWMLYHGCVSQLENKRLLENKDFRKLSQAPEFHNFFLRFAIPKNVASEKPAYRSYYETMHKVSNFFLNIHKNVAVEVSKIDENMFTGSVLFMLSEFEIEKIDEVKLGNLKELSGDNQICIEYVINLFKDYQSISDSKLLLKITNILKRLKLGLNLYEKIKNSKIAWEKKEALEPCRVTMDEAKRNLVNIPRVAEACSRLKEERPNLDSQKNEIKRKAYIDFQEQLKQQLQTEDAIAFHGGYHGKEKEAGHTILFEIEKQPDGKFCLRLINTGEDTPGWFLKDNVCSYINIENIAEDLLLDVFHNFENKNVGDFYQKLSKFKQETCRIKQQKFGTCSMSCIWAWLEYHLFHKEKYDREEYNDLKIDLLLKKIECLVFINNKFIQSKFNSSSNMSQYQFENTPPTFNQANFEKAIALGLEIYKKKTGKQLKGIKLEF